MVAIPAKFISLFYLTSAPNVRKTRCCQKPQVGAPSGRLSSRPGLIVPPPPREGAAWGHGHQKGIYDDGNNDVGPQ
jgi:hypothetical protein